MVIQRAKKTHIPGLIRLLYQVGDVHHKIRPDIFRAGALKYDENELEMILQDETKPIFDEMNRIKWKGKREKFQESHDQELRMFYVSRRMMAKMCWATASARSRIPGAAPC